MSANAIQFAHNPDLFNSRSVVRPLSSRETMQRAKAICAGRPSPRTLPCSGQIFIGMFFDGTGNNEQIDYIQVRNKPADQKQSNVVRLYHAYPTEPKGTTKYYPFYIPGVGTPFPEIGDEGGKVGTATSWDGEPRLIWGITNVFNAVSDYVSGEKMLPAEQAAKISNSIGGIGSTTLRRNHEFKSKWIVELKKNLAIKRPDKPSLEQINLSVYGFSRGAAEARAFVNWLYALCDEIDGAYCFAGIPVRVEFLGIFDTVASVGIAGGFTSGLLGSEGHQSWAKDNMQVHQGVESCLHIVAGHEVRATFPMDSVRVEDKYPANAKEYVYPGSHSDVGGGYHPSAQGKSVAVARIPGFEMYCAAMASGVPFFNLKELNLEAVQALVPTQDAVDIFRKYYLAAGIKPGPVEEMMRQHMGHYFNYRYQARSSVSESANSIGYTKRNFYKKGVADRDFLRGTQRHFLAILAALSVTTDHIMKSETAYDRFLIQPFQSEGSFNGYALIFNYAVAIQARHAIAKDKKQNWNYEKEAGDVRQKVKKWREWLADHLSPELIDAKSPERNILSVVDTLTDVPLSPDVVDFFDNMIHDSLAGLALQGLDEFFINGIGIAKFRRVYFGDRGDMMLHEVAEEINKARTRTADALRAQRRQWDLESAEFARTR